MHHDRPGDQTGRLKEVLGGPVTRERQRVDTDTSRSASPAFHRFDHVSPDAHPAGIGMGVDLLDDGQEAICNGLKAGYRHPERHIKHRADHNQAVGQAVSESLLGDRCCVGQRPGTAITLVALPVVGLTDQLEHGWQLVQGGTASFDRPRHIDDCS